ncbi:MAG: hypothetical protein V4613_13770 [Bacteroidota bacterium]
MSAIGPKTTPTNAINYDSAKAVIKQQRIKLKAGLDKKTIRYDSVGRAFTDYLVNDIFPYWYGTTWDFNGYTAIPQQGAIACGYFVSTTLLHNGVKLNRYKMAQKSSMDGALMLEPKDSLYIKRSSRDIFLSEFKKTHKNGLYMVGLSNHVGYLYKQDNAVYFIHSSYVTPVAVVIEDAATSVALGYSTIFVVADITYNEELMQKWLNGTTVPH